MPLVDGVEAVPERPGAMADGDAIGAKQPGARVGVFHPPVGNHVDCGAGHHLTICGLGQNCPHRALELGEGVRPAPQSGRPFGLQDAAGPELYPVYPREQPVIGQQRRIELVKVLTEVSLQRAVAGDEINRPISLIVAASRIQHHCVSLTLELQVERVPLISHAGVIHVVSYRVLALGDHFQRFLPHQSRGVRLILISGGQHGVFSVAVEHLEQSFLGAPGR